MLIYNIFLNLNQIIKREVPDYKYVKENKIFNKNTINIKFKNNSLNIFKNNYFKIYDCGYTIYRLTRLTEIEEFLISNNIDYIKDNNKYSFQTENYLFEINYIDSVLYSLNNINRNYFYKLSKNAEENNIFKFWIKDYEWNDTNKREILKSYILHAANKTKTRIFARKCIVKEVDNKTARQFETENCFYGKRGSTYNLGLYYNDELVMLYTFGHNFYGNNDSIEIIRVGTIKNTIVVGGSSKLFKNFIKRYKDIPAFKNKKQIVFYSDYDHNIGNSLSNLNFEFTGYSGGGIMNYWIKDDIIKHRQPTKHKYIKEQIKMGNCLELPNAGIKKFVYKLNI